MRIIYTIALISLINIAFGQHPGRQMPENMAKIGTLSGRVLEAKKEPLEYVNVSLYRLRDSSLVAGTISDKNGWYRLSELSFGRYYVEYKFIGFEKQQSKPLIVSPKNSDVQMPEITLLTSANELNEVEIVEQRNPIEYKLDKKIVNVSQDLTSVGATAVEVLENTPSVETDIDGNVSLRGSSNFLVLVDGKRSIFEGSDALKQIPASTIENIEIITNPSAKYDPDGVSGIINVVTKKNALRGINGIINLSVATHDKYSGDITLGYKTSKFNLFGSINYSDQTHFGGGTMERNSYLFDTTYNSIALSERNRTHYNQSYKAGFDYYLNPANTISFSTSVGQRGFARYSFSDYHDFNSPATYDDYYTSENDFDVSRDYLRFDVDYAIKFKEKGHKLNLSLYQISQKGNNIESLTEKETTSDWESILKTNLRQNTYENSKGNKLFVKADYEKPLDNGKIEAGYQFRYEFENELYSLDQIDTTELQWVTLSQYNNETDFTKYIQSVYYMQSGKYGIIDYQVGLRSEYTNRVMVQKILNEKFPVKRLDWFPSVHVSLDLSDENQVQASYSRRIDRPRGWYLDPFVNYIDKQNIRVGNPLLEPEYIDSYEFNFQRKFGKSFVSSELYYRQTNNLISRIHTLDTNNVMKHTFANVDKDYSFGVELMANLNLVKWWRLNATANFFNYKVSGDVEGVNLVQNTNTWSTRLNSTFMLGKSTRLQLIGFYNGPSVTIQGNRDDFFFTNIGVKQDFLNRKLSVTVQLRDVFGTMKHSFNTAADNYDFRVNFTREPRILTIQLSYVINNYKKERNGSEGRMDFDEGDM